MVLNRTTSRDPYDAWQALCAKYEPTTVEAYNQIIRDMEMCELKEPNQDPEPWMPELN